MPHADTANVAVVGTFYVQGVYQIGCTIVEQNIKLAGVALAYGRTSRDTEQALAYVQGSDLETTIATFNLTLNADRLREEFMEWVLRHRPKSASSSAITQATS